MSKNLSELTKKRNGLLLITLLFVVGAIGGSYLIRDRAETAYINEIQSNCSRTGIVSRANFDCQSSAAQTLLSKQRSADTLRTLLLIVGGGTFLFALQFNGQFVGQFKQNETPHDQPQKPLFQSDNK